MANTKSAEKAARQAEKHRAHNVTLRSRMRSAIRGVADAVAAGKKEEAQKSYAAAVPIIVTPPVAARLRNNPDAAESMAHFNRR